MMIWRKMPFCFEYIYEGRHLCLPDPPWTSLLPRGTGTSWIIIFNWKFISSKLKFSSKNSSWLSWIFHWKWCFNWSLYLVVTDPGKPLLLSNKRNAGLVCSIMSNASLYLILDEGLETFLEIRDLEIYILLIYMVTRLQNYRTYRLLALFLLDVFLLCDNRSVQLPQVGIIRGCGTPVLEF